MMIRRRNELSAIEVAELSQKIEENLFECKDFLRCQRILFYLSFGNEVATDDMIERSLALQKKVWVPRIDKGTRRLEICEIESLETGLKINNFGIREPSGPQVQIVSLEKIDAVVTPGLAFDSTGGRIGFGGGYYDKLFEELPDSSLRIGIAYGFQIFGSLQQDPWDQKVQKVVTENDILNS